jgi:hypothetical protein
MDHYHILQKFFNKWKRNQEATKNKNTFKDIHQLPYYKYYLALEQDPRSLAFIPLTELLIQKGLYKDAKNILVNSRTWHSHHHLYKLLNIYLLGIQKFQPRLWTEINKLYPQLNLQPLFWQVRTLFADLMHLEEEFIYSAAQYLEIKGCKELPEHMQELELKRKMFLQKSSAVKDMDEKWYQMWFESQDKTEEGWAQSLEKWKEVPFTQITVKEESKNYTKQDFKIQKADSDKTIFQLQSIKKIKKLEQFLIEIRRRQKMKIKPKQNQKEFHISP